MAATDPFKLKYYFVVKHDTVVQATGYIVQARNEEEARESVDAGLYVEETKAEILDTLESMIVDVTEIGKK